jgi:putative FmdB family regulatory protein
MLRMSIEKVSGSPPDKITMQTIVNTWRRIMPIYEYVCKDCARHFEVLSTSSGATETVKCPECQSLNIKKTISSTNFRMSSGGPSIPCGPPAGCPSNSGFS